MATITYALLKSRFQTDLRDLSNIVWTGAENDENLTAALNDPKAYRLVRDSSLTTLSATTLYTFPATMNAVIAISLTLPGAVQNTPIDRSHYKFLDNQFTFDSAWYQNVPVGSTINLTGRQPLFVQGTALSTVTVPDYMIEYVLSVAKVEAYNLLRTKLTSGFLKNELSMAELIASARETKTERDRLARSLANNRFVAL